MARKLLLIALAGSAGTLARYWLGGAVQRLFGADFPFGTWAVNILGCLLFGLVWVLSEERFAISGEARVVIVTGFMGAFTTFSTYIFESSGMAGDGQWLALAANLAGQNVLGFAAFYAGVLMGRVV